jgi:hypothetical protein
MVSQWRSDGFGFLAAPDVFVELLLVSDEFM